MIGIYCVTNNVNGKKYIGQSWDIEHRCRKYGHNSHNEHIERAIKKYGIGSFTISCIKQIVESPLTQILLDIYESYYINTYNTTDPDNGYNKRGGGATGKMTEETKKKISATMKTKVSPLIGYKQTPEHIEHSRLGNLGRKCSEETKAKISKATMGRSSWITGKKQSPEHIAKRTAKNIGTKHSELSKLKSAITKAFNKIEWVQS
jgi:group I intron endonuclease